MDRINFQDITLEEEVGRGSYGVVYIGRLPNNKRIVVKKVDLAHLSAKG